MTKLQPRLGFALLTTLLAMLLISAMVTAAALQVDESARSARTLTLHQRAFASAESSLWRTFVSADAHLLRQAPIGLFSQTVSNIGPLTNKVTVTKIDTTLVWIVSDTHLTQGREVATHRLGLWTILPRDTIEMHLNRLPQANWVDLY